MASIKEAITKPEISFFVSILSPIVAVAVTIAVMGNRMDTLEQRFDYFGGRYEARVAYVDSKLEKQDAVFLDIKVKLAEIQKDILYIKEKVK